jgi:type IV pilus assembly protein PilY1
MKILFKLFSLLILIINFNQTSYAKPLPPGSGEGDVPANILILLDSSASMRRTLGDGIPAISSATIDGNGNRVLTSADKSLGGLYLFNSAGERINFTGTNQSGRSYTRDTWWAGSNTDQRCDYRLRDGSRTTNHLISTTRKYHEARYVTGVTVPGTNISNENLLFAVQFDDRSSSVAVIALDTQYRCRLALTVNSVKHIRGMDISANAAGHIIVGVFGRSGRRNAFQMTCNLNQADCEEITGRGKGQTDVFGRIYD